MSPEEKRIAIAEACGWQRKTRSGIHLGSPHSWTEWKNQELPYGASEPPDYLNDLNAMHEAEKVLTPQQHCDYRLELMLSVGGLSHHLATAAQRADAFLLTLGYKI